MGIVELIQKVRDTYKDIGKISLQANQYRKQGKNSLAQTHMVHLKYLHRKLLSLKQELKSSINGSVSYITYEVINNKKTETLEAVLVNVTDSDIQLILELYCQVSHLKFKGILEIKRTPTKLG